MAAKKGHKTIIKLLLEKGARVELKDIFGRTPLLWAAKEGHEAIIRLLKDKVLCVKESSDEMSS
jgi:ankyrin repeat protein